MKGNVQTGEKSQIGASSDYRSSETGTLITLGQEQTASGNF